GYAATSGPELARSELSGEAIRLTRLVHAALPEDPEVAGLLALTLLTEARRPARTGPDGELVPLAEQDRTRWDQDLVAEGVALITDALAQGTIGEYRAAAAGTVSVPERDYLVAQAARLAAALIVSPHSEERGCERVVPAERP